MVSLGLGFNVNPLFSIQEWSYSISKCYVDEMSSTIPEFLCFNNPLCIVTLIFYLLLSK
jgi:hypothetical protein